MTNPTIPLQFANTIPLTNGRYAIVDSSDFEWLLQWNWCVSNGYAGRTIHLKRQDGKKVQKSIAMHRIIMNAPDNMSVDHINGNRLDNRRSNLRICTHNENCKNMKHRDKSKKKTSKYKGVYYSDRDQKWIARIMSDRKQMSLGYFNCEQDAAMAYNAGALKYHGEFANINVFT